MKKCVLFIGADYTSIWAYKQLVSKDMLKEIKSGALELVMICDKKHHSFNALYGEVITGVLPEEAIYTPLRQVVKHARIIQGKAISVSPFLQTVTYDTLDGSEKEISYDHLVMGCGMEDSSKYIAGLSEHSISIRKPYGLTELRTSIKNNILDFYIGTSGVSSNIIVIGSGLSGIETVSYISEYVDKEYNKKSGKPSIYLINAKGKTLKEGGLSQSTLAQYANNVLKRNGVHTIVQAYAKEIFEEGVLLSDGSFITAQLIVQALGKNTVPVKGLKHLSLNPSKKIETDTCLNAKGYDNIWCGGEVSLVAKPNTNEYCSSDPVWLIMQGAQIGKNIKRSLQQKAPQKFEFSGLEQMASLGTGKSTIELFGLPLWGWLAYLIRISMLFYFFPAKMRLLNFWWKNFIGKKNGLSETLTYKKFNSETRSLVMNRQKRSIERVKVDQE